MNLFKNIVLHLWDTLYIRQMALAVLIFSDGFGAQHKLRILSYHLDRKNLEAWMEWDHKIELQF